MSSFEIVVIFSGWGTHRGIGLHQFLSIPLEVKANQYFSLPAKILQ